MEIVSTRYQSFDFLKGIACVAVVLIHFVFPGSFGTFIKMTSRFAVPIFFLISGFFFVKKSTCTIADTARKLHHSVSLVLFAGVFHAIYLPIFMAITNDNWTSAEFLSEKVTVSHIAQFFIMNRPFYFSHLWYLLALVYVYLFALVWFGDGKRLWTAGPLGFILLGGMALSQEFSTICPFPTSIPISGSNLRLTLCHMFFFRALPFFLLGVWVRLHEMQIKHFATKIPNWVLWILAAIGGACAILEFYLTKNAQFYLGNFLTCASMVLWAIKNPYSGIKSFVFIGNSLSLYIYIFHIIIGKVIYSIIYNMKLLRYPVVICARPLLVIVGSIFLAFLIFYLSNKTTNFFNHFCNQSDKK